MRHCRKIYDFPEGDSEKFMIFQAEGDLFKSCFLFNKFNYGLNREHLRVMEDFAEILT